MKRQTHDGFTLVELLVVISILGILASILLPALSRSKESARQISCVNTERQLGLTASLFSNDNQGRLVNNGLVVPGDDPTDWVNGAFVLGNWIAREEKMVLDERFAQFSPYLKSVRNYQCASDPTSRVRSYALNLYYHGDSPKLQFSSSADSVFRIFSSESEILRPAQIFTFMDIHPLSICWPFAGVHMTANVVHTFPGRYHGNRANVTFADGHVQSHKWRTARMLNPDPGDFDTMHLHAHPVEPRNEDLAWIRSVTTHP